MIGIASALAAISLAAAACGSNSGSGNSGSGNTGGGTSTTAAGGSSQTPGSGIPTAQESMMLHNEVPASLRNKTLVFALDASYAPDEMLASNGSTVIGMDADLALAIGQVLGVKVKLQNATFDTIIPGLLSGKFNVGDSSFTDTIAREKQVDFVDYFSAGEGFYEAANNSTAFNGLTSLCGHSVAVEAGTTEEIDAKSQAKKCTVNVLSYQDQNSANLAVSSGRAQVGFADSQVAAYIVKQSNGQFKLTGTPFETAPYGIAVPKDGLDTPLLGAIKTLMSDGIYSKILAKWGTTGGAIAKPVINGATS